MRYTLRSWLVILVVALSTWGFAASAWAKPIDLNKRKEVEPRAYLVPYIVTVIMIGIGLTALCRPVHRKVEVEVPQE